MLTIREVSDKRDLRKFVRLPFELHRDHPNWMPTLYRDDLVFFDPRRNPAFHACDFTRLLAEEDGRVVGRVMGLVHHGYNKAKNEHSARFGYLECPNDLQVARGLLDQVARWAGGKGCNKLIGPYGFSEKDVQGLQIEGFQFPPIIDSACNFEWMPSFLEQLGFSKEIDCLSFEMDLRTPLPPVYERIADRSHANPTYHFLQLKRKSEIKPYVIPILRLLNETYKDLYGFVEMSEKDMTDLATRYQAILDPGLIKACLVSGRPIAFLVAVPSLYEGFRRSGGYLFPFGIFHLFREMKRTRQIDLMLGAVVPAYQGRGLEVALAIQLFKEARQRGFERMEIHLVLETNLPMIREMEKAGARQVKRFRVFQKKLSPGVTNTL